jgi:hypothetical protein
MRSYFSIILIFSVFPLFFGCQKIRIGNEESIELSYQNPGGVPSVIALDSSKYVSFSTVNATHISNSTTRISVEGVTVNYGSIPYSIEKVVFEECNSETCREKDWDFTTEYTNDQGISYSPVLAVLVLDLSSSIGGEVENLKQYAKDFAREILERNNDSRVGLVLFTENFQSYPFENYSGLNNIYSNIDGYVDYQNRTLLLESCVQALDMLENSTFPGEKVMVAFTDGKDTHSDNPPQVLKEIQESGIRRVSIGVKGKDFDRNAIEELATSTDLATVADDYNDLKDVFRKVGNLVSSIYRFDYDRSNQMLDEAIRIRLTLEIDKIK